jgi:hypothetical protein
MTRAQRGLALIILVILSALGFGSVAQAAPVIQTSSERYDLWFSEDFNTNVGWGQWPGDYYKNRFATYGSGQIAERGIGPAVYDNTGLTVHNGALDMFAYKANVSEAYSTKVPAGWTPMASVVIPKSPNGGYLGFRYGRYEFSLGVDVQGSDGMDKWWLASLLWPMSDAHCDGEVDFPEFTPGDNANLWQHIHGMPRAKPTDPCVDKSGNPVNPQNTCYSKGGLGTSSGWHYYTIDWKPTGITYYRDGVQVGLSNCSNPDVEMRYTLQLVTLNRMPTANSYGHVYMDWLRIYKYYWS